MDYGRLLVRNPEYEVHVAEQGCQSPLMTLLSSRQVPEANCYLALGWVYNVPKPNPYVEEHVHDFDEILLFWGGNHELPQVLGAEVEFYIGGQAITFNTIAGIFIPRGVPHGPLVWRKVSSPHIRMVLALGTGAPPQGWNERGAGKGSVGLTGREKFDYEQYVVRSPMREAGAEFVKGRTSPTLTMVSGVQIPGVKCYIEMGWTFDYPEANRGDAAMPEMAHSFDEVVLHVGGDPSNPEELGGDVEFWVEGQPLLFDTTSALFVPQGVRHGPLRCKVYRKPHMVIAIMLGAGSLREGWGNSFQR